MTKYSIKFDIARLTNLPNQNSQTIDELLNGWEFEILESANNNFYKVKTFYNYTGYLEKKHIIKTSLEFNKSQKAIVVKKFLDLLSEPCVKSKVLKTLIQGSIVGYIGKIDDYYSQIITSQDLVFYVRSDGIKQNFKPIWYLELGLLGYKKEKELRENIIKTSKTYLESQYRWGGKTPVGIDCSGLTFMSYLINGIIIERDTISSAFEAQSIEYDKIKKSDLLYLKGHVIMCVDKEKYIHSSFKTSGAYISSFKENHLNMNYENFRKEIIWCRKVI